MRFGRKELHFTPLMLTVAFKPGLNTEYITGKTLS